MAASLRWGFVSTANIGRKNVQALLEAEGNEIVAVASRSKEKAEGWIEKCGLEGVRAVEGYDSLLDAEDIDALYIPIPTTMHEEIVIRAAKAGKHILCEKPTAVSSDGLERMLAAVEEAGVMWMDGVMFMHHERLEKVKENLEKLGKGLVVSSGFSFSATEEWLSSDIRTKPDCDPLGALGDLGWYNIRFSCFALGYKSPSTAVCIANRINAHGVPTDVSVILRWKKESGRGDGEEGEASGGGKGGEVVATANFQCSFHHAFRQWVEVTGTEASLRMDDFVLPMKKDIASFDIVRASLSDLFRDGTVEKDTITAEGCQEVRMFERFAREAREESSSSKSFFTAVSKQTQAVIDACMHSMQHEGEEAPVKSVVVAIIVAIFATSSNAYEVTINNTQPWRSSDGSLLPLQDGNVVELPDGGFGFFGMVYGNCTEQITGCANTTVGECGFRLDHGVWGYRSSSFGQSVWEFGGDLLPVHSGRPAGIYYRPKVQFNPVTKRWVLWVRWVEPVGLSGNTYYLTASSATPFGEYTVEHPVVNVLHFNGGDMDILVDGNDAYLVYSARTTQHALSVEKLTPDWLSSTNKTSGIFSQVPDVEGSVGFKRNGVYYVMAGHLCCFCSEGAGAHVFAANAPLGPYTYLGQVGLYPNTKTSVTRSQEDFVFQLGSTTLWQGNQWQSAPNHEKNFDLQYWAPLAFDDSKSPPTVLQFNHTTSFSINTNTK